MYLLKYAQSSRSFEATKISFNCIEAYQCNAKWCSRAKAEYYERSAFLDLYLSIYTYNAEDLPTIYGNKFINTTDDWKHGVRINCSIAVI